MEKEKYPYSRMLSHQNRSLPMKQYWH